MFYPLEGPAPRLQPGRFAHKLCLMQKASAAGRPLAWFPEGAWWLTFDNPIPVYLPLHILARGSETSSWSARCSTKNGGTLDDHKMFNSGQEWGYWQQDYAVGLVALEHGLSMDDVLGEIARSVLLPRGVAAELRRAGCGGPGPDRADGAPGGLPLDSRDVRGTARGAVRVSRRRGPGDEIAASPASSSAGARVVRTVMGWGKSQLSISGSAI